MFRIDFVIVEVDVVVLLAAIPEVVDPPGVGGDSLLLAGDDGDVDMGPDPLVGVCTGPHCGDDEANSYHLIKMKVQCPYSSNSGILIEEQELEFVDIFRFTPYFITR